MNFFAEADSADQMISDKINQTVVNMDLLFFVINFGVVWYLMVLFPKQKVPSAEWRTKGIINFRLPNSQ